jgi:transcriptional regulator with XRE-family HTH domain
MEIDVAKLQALLNTPGKAFSAQLTRLRTLLGLSQTFGNRKIAQALGFESYSKLRRYRARVQPKNNCENCGALGYLVRFKGRELCRSCLIGPDEQPKQSLTRTSNFGQSI